MFFSNFEDEKKINMQKKSSHCTWKLLYFILTGTLVRTSPKRTLYVRALFDYDPNKVNWCSKATSFPHFYFFSFVFCRQKNKANRHIFFLPFSNFCPSILVLVWRVFFFHEYLFKCYHRQYGQSASSSYRSPTGVCVHIWTMYIDSRCLSRLRAAPQLLSSFMAL